MTAQHQAAAGVAVEPVRQRRRVRQAETQGVEMSLEIVAAAGAGMDRHSRGLVDDQAEPVAIEQALQQFGFAHQSILTTTLPSTLPDSTASWAATISLRG